MPEKLPFVQSENVAPDEAVEDRPLGEVAVQVDAPAVAGSRVRLVARERAWCPRSGWRGSCAGWSHTASASAPSPLICGTRKMSSPSTNAGRLRVGPVVAHEPLRGLEADARGRDLVAVLLAVEEDADLRAVARLADPQHVLGLRAARERRRRAQQVAERRDRAGHDDCVAGRGAPQRRGHDVGERRVGVQRGDDLRRGARDRARGVRRQADADRVAGDAHRSAASPPRRGRPAAPSGCCRRGDRRPSRSARPCARWFAAFGAAPATGRLLASNVTYDAVAL